MVMCCRRNIYIYNNKPQSPSPPLQCKLLSLIEYSRAFVWALSVSFYLQTNKQKIKKTESFNIYFNSFLLSKHIIKYVWRYFTLYKLLICIFVSLFSFKNTQYIIYIYIIIPRAMVWVFKRQSNFIYYT